MKSIFAIVLLGFCSCNFLAYSQDAYYGSSSSSEPIRFIPKNHEPDFAKRNKMPAKSFYKSRSDWQHIIDSTWGPGDSLSRKLLIFNTFAQKIHDQFDGFLSLQLNWDSLYNHYLGQINDSTSKGAFASIMVHFANDLRDMHTYAFDESVVLTPLNPGVPVLLISNFITVEHFGANTTVLPDSTILVLRVVPNHPLNLEPGDIILGYEGVPWKNLVYELLDAGLPIYGIAGGCKSAVTYHTLIGCGLNWHLFDTIDIIKHSTGDTVHLSVLPMLNLNIPPMLNNEQLAIPNIPFPNVVPSLPDTCVTYGVLENTNIGYIFLAAHWPTATADLQMYQAIDSLKNTDALILDMRFCFGGYAEFDRAFELLFHENHQTISESYRCGPTTFDLCPINDEWKYFKIDVKSADYYDRPIAVLIGPSAYSMADITEQRLRYHPMVRFFGSSPDASLGYSSYINTFSDWGIRYSIADVFHMSEPGVYLNRKEFPVDDPVWFNSDDVAMGIDPMVQKSLDWINNLVYGHEVATDKLKYSPDGDTVTISAIIENPNANPVSAKIIIESLDGTVVDSISMDESKTPEGKEWQGKWVTPGTQEETFWLSLKTEDLSGGSYFTSRHSTRITTIPLLIDSIGFTLQSQAYYKIKPFLTNAGSSQLVSDLSVSLSSSDSWVKSIIPAHLNIDTLLPGETEGLSGSFGIQFDTAGFPGNFNLTFTISSECFTHWVIDTNLRVTPAGTNEQPGPLSFRLGQNYPNPFYPVTKIAFTLPARSFVTLKIFDLRGMQVATIVSEELAAGEHTREWKATNLPAGIYFYQLQAGSNSATRKLVLLR